MLTTLRQRNFTLLWLGGMISQTGDWLLQIGLPVYVYLLTGSALTTSLLFMTAFVPNIVFGSVAGIFVDRWDRRRMMLIGNVLMALGLLPLLLLHDKSSLWILYPVLFFEATVEQFVVPAQKALLPHLVSEAQLVTANSLNSAGSSVSRLAGGALGGILFGLFGLHTTIWLDLISFLFVAAMIWLIKLPMHTMRTRPILTTEQPATEKAPKALAIWQKLGVEWLEGIQLISHQGPLIVLFVILAVQSIGEGVFGVMLVIFVKLVLHGGATVYGTLLGVQAIGGLLGGLAVGQFGTRVAPARLLGICSSLFGLIDLLIVDLPVFVKGGVVLVGLLFVLVGIPGAGMIVGTQTLFQTLTEDRLRGRVFGAIQAVSALMMLIGMTLAGLLGDRLGPVLLLNIQGSAYFLTGILALLTLGRMQLKMSRENVSA